MMTVSPLTGIPETWTGFFSAVISFLFFWDIVRRYFPAALQQYLVGYCSRLSGFLNPNMEISIREYSSGSHLKAHEAFAIVEAYLSVNSDRAKRLKAQIAKENENKLVFSMDEDEEAVEVFNGVEVKWSLGKLPSPPRPAGLLSSYYSEPERRVYKLKCRKAYKKMITEAYLQEHVLKTGREILSRNRQRKFFTHSRSKSYWSLIPFQSPATFEILAMEPELKMEIIDDLLAFSKGKEAYERVGKAWKRGYLLHGPPGTGKSTMIAAMANLLDYDVYEIDLTLMKDNAELRKLLMETKAKSVIVIEDIDCSLDLTGQRKKTTTAEKHKDDDEKMDDSSSKVTLSGLLNSTDGLWSACSVGEKLVVFTTNHIEKLDPALIRRGRMDRRIQFSHCGYQGFKVLAKNYLQLEAHPLFEVVEELINKVEITPADVAEELIPKSGEDGPEQCLRNLIATLHHRIDKRGDPTDLQIANNRA